MPVLKMLPWLLLIICSFTFLGIICFLEHPVFSPKKHREDSMHPPYDMNWHEGQASEVQASPASSSVLLTFNNRVEVKILNIPNELPLN